MRRQDRQDARFQMPSVLNGRTAKIQDPGPVRRGHGLVPTRQDIRPAEGLDFLVGTIGARSARGAAGARSGIAGVMRPDAASGLTNGTIAGPHIPGIVCADDLI